MKPKFHRKVLKNGMTVILEKRDIPVVSVAFAVRAGGINESEEEKGISHFIEHMLYKGTPKRNSQAIATEIERNGGELNGFTDEAITAYWCRMPSKHLDVALDVLSDMVKNPLFDKKELEKEREVIFEEIKMYHDNPRMHVFYEIKRNLYSGAFGMNLGGTFETMGSINRDKMVEKFKQVYKPNNMVLCVVGDANFEKLVEFAERNFSGEKGKIPEQKFELRNESRIEKRKGIDQANLIFAYHSPLAKDNKSHAAQVLTILMAGGMSSRLFQEIREKRNLAYAVKGDCDIARDYAYSLIYVGTTKENVNKVKKIILDEFEKVSKNLKEKELKEIKEQIIGNHLISMEDSQNQMANLLAYEIDGNAKEFYNYVKNISEVSLGDVKELAKKAKEKFSFFALVPE